MIGELLAIVVGQGLYAVGYGFETLDDGLRDEIGGLVFDLCQYGIATLTFHQ